MQPHPEGILTALPVMMYRYATRFKEYKALGQKKKVAATHVPHT